MTDASQRPAGMWAEAKGLFSLSWPVMVLQLGSFGLGLVDLTIVGFIGRDQQAAVGLGLQFMTLLESVIFMMLTGVRILVSHSYGAGDREGLRSVLWEGLLLGVLLIPPLASAYLWVDNFLGMFQPTEQVHALAVTYIRIRLFGLPFMVFAINVGHFFHGLGETRIPMYITVSVMPLNALVSYWFVMGGWGIPQMGLAGAAYGSVLALFVAALLSGGACLRPKIRRVADIRPPRHVAWQRMLVLMRLGGGITMVGSSRMVVDFLITGMVSGLGSLALSAYCLAVQVSNLLNVPAYGLQMATSIVVGQRLGAGDQAGVRQAAVTSLRTTVVVAAMIGIGVIAASDPLSRGMASTAAVALVFRSLLAIVAFQLVLMAIGQSLGGVLLGGGHIRLPLVAQLVTLGVLLFPLIWLFAYKLDWGVYGFPLAMGCQGTAMVLIIAVGMRRLAWDQGSLAQGPP